MFLTRDQAQFSFRFVNNIPAGKAIAVAVKPSPLFFRLASDAFPDIGSVGGIEKKKQTKKRITRSFAIGGPGTPGRR